MAHRLLTGLTRFTAPTPSVGPTTLILDQFTDTNGTAIASHTIAPTNTVAATWATDIQPGGGGGVWTIQSNKLTVTNTAGVKISQSYVDAGVADCSVSFDLTPLSASNDQCGLISRWVNNNSFWFLRYLPHITQLDLLENNAGALTSRANASVSPGATFALKLTMSGNSFTAYIDGVEIFSYSSALFNTATKHGCGMLNTATGYTANFDNFTVTTP